MRFYETSLAMVLLVLAGCATPIQEQQNALAQRTICCKGLAEFAFLELKFKDEMAVHVDENSQVYEFDAHKRYFSALSMPDRHAREIHIKSYFNGFVIGQYLNPNVLLLDRNYEVIERMSVPMRFYSGDLFGDQNAHMYGFVRVPDNARYLVIYGRNPGEGAAVATIHSGGMSYFTGSTFVYSPPSSTTQNLEFSPTGSLKVWVDTTL